MPLLDHFHPPLGERRHWEAFHARWASAIADDLNERGLPDSLFAEPTVHVGGQMQIDVATFEDSLRAFGSGAATTATLPQVVTVLAPTWVVPAVFPDTYSVHVLTTEGGPRLVAAIELISPSNKDRPESRRAFAVKCANFVAQSIPFIVIDIVTSRSANLHNEIMELMRHTDFRLDTATLQYAVAYRPVRRESKEEIEVWAKTFEVGDHLPNLPLYFDAEQAVMLDFEETYQETCSRLRIVE